MSEKEKDTSATFPFDTGKRILDYPAPVDHARMMLYLECLRERYPFLEIRNIGTSVLGKNIPLISLGEGEKCILYAGSHLGTDRLSCVILLRFINEYAENFRSGRHIYNVYLPYLYRQRRILIIPMLNPDGTDYVLNGVSEDNPLQERLIRMNGGNCDFSRWCANGRGVDLRYNYDVDFDKGRAAAEADGITQGAPEFFGGESPESEPEIAYLCNYLRYFRDQLSATLLLQGSGEQITYSSCTSTLNRALPLAQILSRLSGYKILSPEQNATHNGLTDYCIRNLSHPAFTIACGKNASLLPQESYFCAYAAVRQLLFEAPQLI